MKLLEVEWACYYDGELVAQDEYKSRVGVASDLPTALLISFLHNKSLDAGAEVLISPAAATAFANRPAVRCHDELYDAKSGDFFVAFVEPDMAAHALTLQKQLLINNKELLNVVAFGAKDA